MAKFKMLAVAALAAGALLMGPTAAQAAYVPNDNISVNGLARAGAVLNVIFAPGSFTGEDVSFAATGKGRAKLAVATVVETVTVVKEADASGAVSVDVTLPADASGTYTITATGLTSGTVGTAAITVAAADGGAAGSGDELADTGASDSSMLLIWGASGVLLLGVALVVVMTTVRRQRSNL